MVATPRENVMRSVAGPALGMLILAGVQTQIAAASDMVVETSNGKVLGYIDPDYNAACFRGIPFAASTAGANRWRPPQPKAAWAPLILNATTNAAGCVQAHHNPDVPCDGNDGPRCQSEDCLNLNVFCPAANLAAPAGKLQLVPTLLFIHGGAFDEGSNRGAFNMYDGAYMAATGGVCVVASNYRLGVLGSLVVGSEGSDGRGNHNLRDQRAAMEWIQREIHNFGGDNRSVTIAGESAGAMSVLLHLVSPPSQGLFHRAIMESSPSSFQYQDYAAQAATFGKDYAKLSNCTHDGAGAGADPDPAAVMKCLRALPAKEAFALGEQASGSAAEGILDRILEGGRVEDALAMEWSPVVDGELSASSPLDAAMAAGAGAVQLPAQPLQLFEAGAFRSVPLLVGTNQDEAATFIYAGLPKKVPELLFEPLMKVIFGKTDGPKVVAFYAALAKADDWTDMRDSFSQVLTDYWFKCGSAHVAGLMADKQAAVHAAHSTYMYRFAHLSSFAPVFAADGLPKVCESRVCHGTELPYVFHSSLPGNYSFNESELGLSRAMVAYWTQFARAGNPNAPAGNRSNDDGSSSSYRGNSTVDWPSFSTAARRNLRLAIPIVAESTTDGSGAPPQEVCAFFDSIGYNH